MAARKKAPKYRQICRTLRSEIHAHHKPGDRLPTEPQLVQRFSVNRHTVRRALDCLVAEGLVRRRQGQGTFVCDHPIVYPVTKKGRFTENIAQLGINATCRVLLKKVIPARGEIGQRLALPEKAPVIQIDTLREVDALPTIIISHYLPRDGFETILTTYASGSLHHVLGRMGILLERRESIISARLPNETETRHLQMPAHQPVLTMKTVNVNTDTRQPVEFALGRARADRIQLRMGFDG